MTPNEIREMRTKSGMTQIEAAIACGVSVAAFRLWELGGSKPNEENAAKLISVLGGAGGETKANTTE